MKSEQILEGVAIIGVHGRFPGAGSTEEFWDNLVAGRDTMSFFSDADLIASGLDPAVLRQAGTYVPARGVLKDAECFDAAFFGIHPKEAEVMDPQHRVFLEACWEALERAGYAPGRIQGSVGVYAGAMYNTYYLSALHPRPELRELVGHEQVMLGNEKDYLATRVAYKLDLKGPAISMNTGCSSSLVAVCQAYQALMTFPVRHGARGRRVDPIATTSGVLLSGGEHRLTRRAHENLRCCLPRHGFQQRRDHGRPETPV